MVVSMNESAFPYAYFDKQLNQTRTMYGMSLRDYFAARALQGLLANPKLQAKILAEGGCVSGWIETSAWAFADEMLKARGE
jgi:hypothetical protein